MLDPCHLYVEDEPCSGAWNMAVDESLLIDAVEHGRCHLRFYRWREPTLSLGYFQKPEERLAEPRLAELPAVRRLSGGGAILHDDEWTYSCVVPSRHELARRPLELYDVLHDAFVAVLRRLGVDIRARGVEAAHDAMPFLCFGRGDQRDLVIDGHKVLGSAQRRRRGAVLQHGSLLLRASQYAVDVPGLFDLGEVEWPEDIPGRIATIASAELGPLRPSVMSEELSSRARGLMAEKYERVDWRST